MTLIGKDLDGALLDVNLRGRQIFDILPRLQALGLRSLSRPDTTT